MSNESQVSRGSEGAALALAAVPERRRAALAAAVDHVSTRYSAGAAWQRDDLVFVTVSPTAATAAIRDLRDSFGFTHLVFLTAVDVIEQGEFRLVYMLHNPVKHTDIAVQTHIAREGSTMESIDTLWEQAATYQRELKEMFGIDFPGSPRVDESFILEGWHDIPPMRREFDTKAYSEATYFPRPGRRTTDTKAHMKANLYPDPQEAPAEDSPTGENPGESAGGPALPSEGGM